MFWMGMGDSSDTYIHTRRRDWLYLYSIYCARQLPTALETSRRHPRFRSMTDCIRTGP